MSETKFSVMASLFNWMQNSKSSTVKRSKFRKFLDTFCRPKNGAGYFAAIRLILPSLDWERGSYGLREHVLATCIIDALGISRDSPDSQRLLNWRKGGAKSGVFAGNFALVASEVLQQRQGMSSGDLTIIELNELLDRLASSYNTSEKTSVLSELIRKTNVQEMKWIIMIILKDLKLGISEKSIFHEFHPDAEDLFNVTCDLKLVCEKLQDRSQRHKRQDIGVGKPVRPQLALRVSNAAAACKKVPQWLDYCFEKNQKLPEDEYNLKPQQFQQTSEIFTPIADAILRVDAILNLIGVVVDASAPRDTAGSDFFCSVKITDQSQPSGFYLHFFANPIDKLPSVRLGDILMVSNFKIKTRGRADVYGMFVKRTSNFAIFEGISDDLEPYQVSPKYEYKPSREDENYITGLRKWHYGDKLEVLLEPLFLREIREGKNCILLCKILHVAQVKKDEWMLFIWDGTDTPTASVNVNLEDEMENPLPLAVESSPLSREILRTFPPVGTVLRMTVCQGYRKLDIELLRPKRWVKFTNIRCEATAALWHAVLTPSSKLTYFPDDDNHVVQRRSIYEERVESKWGRMPFTSFHSVSRVTETDHRDVPFVTLMDVLTQPQVAYRFKCVVRAVAVSPWMPEYLFSPSNSNGMRLTLEDPTARLRACLFPEDWPKFFGEHSPDVRMKKLKVLLGVESDSMVENISRDPPWIQCCLRSYSNDKNDVWGSRRYVINDTWCVV